MGNSVGKKLDEKKAAELESETTFSRDEILDLYSQFRFLSCGKETIPRATLNAYLESMVSSGKKEVLRSLMTGFDREGKQDVDFRHFCTSLAISTTKKVHDAIEVTFGLFDKAGDSYITREEFVQSLLGMQRVFNAPELFGEIPQELKTEEGIREWVDNVFLHFDTSNGDKLTFSEFKAAVKEHPALSLITSKYLSDECKDIFGEGLRRRGSFRPRANSRAGRNSISVQNISQSISNSFRGIGRAQLNPRNSLIDKELKVLVCIDHDKNSSRNVQALHRFIRKTDSITLYHQPPRGDAIEAANARMNDLQQKLEAVTEKPIQRFVEISTDSKVVACCRYCDSKGYDFISMGHPGRGSSSSLPWKMIENFSGIGVLIGHIPLDIPLVYLVVFDESDSGKHAIEMANIVLRKVDKLLLISTWQPPSMADIGTAMNMSTQEWNKHLSKLKQEAKARGQQAKDQVMAALPELPPDNIANLVLEATTASTLEDEVAKLGSTYEIHCLITGLRSNSACKKLFEMFEKLPRTAISALVVMN